MRIATRKSDPEPVMLQHLYLLQLTKLALEICRGANPVPNRHAEVGQIQPELGVLSGKKSAVMPVDVAPDIEGPFSEARVCHPTGCQIRTHQVHVLPAAHYQIAGAEYGASDMVKSNATGSKWVETGWRVTPVGQHQSAPVLCSNTF